MKKVFTLALLLLYLLAGCGTNASPSGTVPSAAVTSAAVTSAAVTTSAVTSAAATSAAASSAATVPGTASTIDYAGYLGDWSLQTTEDAELYRMTGLMTYYGSTGISIDEVNGSHVKGTAYSVSGAPSYREAHVAFEGDIKDGVLTASYKDEGWSYSGSLELTFAQDALKADITRDKAGETSLWGIPAGEFTFLRPIETERVTLSDAESESLAAFLSAIPEEMIAPFAPGDLTDAMLIDFVGMNLGLGFMDTSAGHADGKVFRHTGQGAEIDRACHL